MEEIALRAIPGLPGYFAGDDGGVFRRYEGNRTSGTGRLYLNIQVGGVQHRHPLAWYVARAWCGGYEEGVRMRVEIVNGDPHDTRPCNLRWVRVLGGYDPERERARVMRMRGEMESNPADPRHGTRTGYRYGCKCPRCRAMAPAVHMRNEIRKTLREGGAI